MTTVTIVLIVLKSLGLIDLSWFLCFLPMLFDASVIIIFQLFIFLNFRGRR
jgi:hypothetical protein